MALDRLADTIITGARGISCEETEFLLTHATARTLENVSNGRLDGAAAKRVAAKGWQAAKAAARLTDDPKALARLARNSSVQVRRQVALNENIDTKTAVYLWDWAVRTYESDTLTALAPRVPFEKKAPYLVGTDRYEPKLDTTGRVLRSVDPAQWPELLALSARATDPKSPWRLAAAMAYTAEEAGASLLDLYKASPSFVRHIAVSAASRAPMNSDTVEVLISYMCDNPHATLELGNAALDKGDDAALVRLFTSLPDFAAQVSFAKSEKSLPETAAWVLERAEAYPTQAQQILAYSKSINASMGPLVEHALEVTHSVEHKDRLPHVPALIKRLAPYRLSSTAIIRLLSRQADRRAQATVDWLRGEFRHQRPTAEEIASLFASPGFALGSTVTYRPPTHRAANVAVDLSEFVRSLTTRDVRGILRTDWADITIDAFGEYWRDLLTRHALGSYLMRRIHENVGSGVQELQVAMEMLDRANVSLSAALAAARSLLPTTA